MNPEGLQTDSINSLIRVQSIIQIAFLMVTIILFPAVGFFIAPENVRFELIDGYLLAAIASFAIMMVVRQNILRKAIKQSQAKSSLLEKLETVSQTTVTRAAILEVTALYGLMFFFISDNAACMLIVIPAAIGLIISMPTKSQLAHKLDLTQEEKIELNV